MSDQYVDPPSEPDLPAPPPLRPGKFVRDTFVYLIATGINAALPMALLPVLTRVLTPADYGIVAMFAVTLSLTTAFVGISLQGAVSVRFFKLEPQDFARFVTACLVILFGTSIAAAGLVIVFGQWFESLTGVPRLWLLIGVAVAATQMIGLIKLTIWQVKAVPVRFAAFQIGQTILNLSVSLYLILLLGMHWQGRLTGQSLALAGFGLFALFLLWREGLVVRPGEFRRHGRDALRFGVPLLPHIIGRLAIALVDRLIIVALLGLSEAGLFMVGLQVATILGFVADAFNSAFAPWLMRHMQDTSEQQRISIVRATYAGFAALIGTATAMGLLAPPIFDYFLGPAFQASAPLVLPLSFGFAFYGCYLLVTNYIFLDGKTEYLSLISVSLGAFHIVLTYVLVGKLGLQGAALAFPITWAMIFLATFVVSHRLYPMPWRLAFSRRPSSSG